MIMIGLMLEFSLDRTRLTEVFTVNTIRLLLAFGIAAGIYFLTPFPYEVRKAVAITAFAPISSASPAFVADLKTEEAALAARRKTAERRVDSVKKYLTSCMESVGKDKVETVKARISFRKSVQVQIEDEAALPADYVTTTVTKSPDKTAIKKAIQGGQDVTGASLIEKRNIQIK